MKGFKLLIIGILIMTLFGCHVTPYGIYDLRVADKSADILWSRGKELLKLANEDAEVIVNYDDTREGLLVFDVSIHNISNDIILVSPEDFYCNIVNKLDDKVKLEAVNPEKMIKHYSKRLETLNAQKKSNERQDLVFSFFEVADGFTKKTDEERKEDQKEYDDREESQARRANKIMNNRINTEKLRDSYESKSLRRTSLLPGDKIGGRVYFSIKGSIKEFSLNIPIKGKEFKIKYDVEKL